MRELQDGELFPSQDNLNLQPLPRRLGKNIHNVGGTSPQTRGVDEDCDRIAGHTDLFRNLEKFEPDLRAAILRIWHQIGEVNVERASDDADAVETALDIAVDALGAAFKYMQEAYLVAECLEDRAKRRAHWQEERRIVGDFHAQISKKPPSEMIGGEIEIEERRLSWQMWALHERWNTIRGLPTPQRKKWRFEAEELEAMDAEIRKAVNQPSLEELRQMTDEGIAEALRDHELRLRSARKRLTLIHAAMVERDA